MNLIQQLRDYAADNGYSHGDYADTMREAADHIAELEARTPAAPVAQPHQEPIGRVKDYNKGKHDQYRLVVWADRTFAMDVPDGAYVYAAPFPAIPAAPVVAEGLAKLREICDMQARNYGDGIKTHLALISLCEDARELLAAHPAAPAVVAEGLAIREALTQLMSIVRIHSETTNNNFAWAEMSFAEEVLEGRPVAPVASDVVAERLDQLRARFEVWANSRSLTLMRDSEGYQVILTAYAWDAWVAAHPVTPAAVAEGLTPSDIEALAACYEYYEDDKGPATRLRSLLAAHPVAGSPAEADDRYREGYSAGWNEGRRACPKYEHMGEHACIDKSQCWEPCGELGKSVAHAKIAAEPMPASEAPTNGHIMAALATFNEVMPPGGLSKIGHDNVFRALNAAIAAAAPVPASEADICEDGIHVNSVDKNGKGSCIFCDAPVPASEAASVRGIAMLVAESAYRAGSGGGAVRSDVLREIVNESLTAPAAPTDAKPLSDAVQLMVNLAPTVLLALRNTDRGPIASMLETAVRELKAADLAAQSVRDALEQAAQACENERVEDTGTDRDLGYNMAIRHATAAIRSLIQSPSVRDAAQPIAPEDVRDAARWKFFCEHANHRKEKMRFCEWIGYDGVMEHGSHNAAIDSVMGRAIAATIAPGKDKP